MELLTTVHCMLDIDWPAEQLHLFVLDDGYIYQSKSARRKQAPWPLYKCDLYLSRAKRKSSPVNTRLAG